MHAEPLHIYTLPHCPWCKKAKEYLDSYDIPYQEVDVSDEEARQEAVLNRYADFFELFDDSFRKYVEFFLLQDMVTDDFFAVKFFTPFDDFKDSPAPSTVEAYKAYKQNAMEFIKARNSRIRESG